MLTGNDDSTIRISLVLNGRSREILIKSLTYLPRIVEVSSRLLAIETAENPDVPIEEKVDKCLRAAKLLVLNAIVLTAEDSLNGIDVLEEGTEVTNDNRSPSTTSPDYRED